MKKTIQNYSAAILMAILFMSSVANAQWTRNAATSATYLTNTGDNVGIGTTTPAFKLDIRSAAAATMSFKSTGGNASILVDKNATSSTASLTYRTAGANTWQTGCVSNDNYTIRNNSLGSVAMFFDYATNNVGIGTTNPLNSLHVQKTLTGTPTTTPVIARFSNSTLNGYTKVILGSDNSSADGFSTFTAGSSASTQLLGFGVGNAGNTVTQLNLNGNGNVGIGTTTPYNKLTVVAGFDGDGISLLGSVSPIKDVALNFTDATNAAALGLASGGNAFMNGTSPGDIILKSNQGRVMFGVGSATAYPTMAITGTNVGIGTFSPAYKLDVCGTIRAKEVRVETGWCDYVFANDYKLRPLSEVETFIKENKHLPDVTAGNIIETEGLEVGKTSAQMIRKIEELTLYVIELQKQNDKLNSRIETLEKK